MTFNVVIDSLRQERNRLMSICGIPCIRSVHQGPIGSVSELVNLLMATKTAYCTGLVQAGGPFCNLCGILVFVLYMLNRTYQVLQPI